MGSSLSLNQSPMKFKDSTVHAMPNPGITAIHQDESIYSLPCDTMLPHAGLGGGIPTPRKLRVDSARIIPPVPSVATTIVVFMMPGIRCFIIMRVGDAPATLAKAT